MAPRVRLARAARRSQSSARRRPSMPLRAEALEPEIFILLSESIGPLEGSDE